MTTLGRRFTDALTFATQVHASQTRKGTDIPYIGHLLAVASLVIQDGGSEDEAIAALLHDAPEDQGGEQMLGNIRLRFGPEVAAIVAGCSDTFEAPKPPWRPRKEAYLRHLQDAGPQVLRVSLADKLHNAGTILADYRQHGESLWDRFSAGRDDQLWIYRQLANTFNRLQPGPHAAQLDAVVTQLETIANDPGGDVGRDDRSSRTNMSTASSEA